MAGRITEVTKLTETEGVAFSDPASQFTPGWGLKPAGDEGVERVKARAAQGRKKTPKLGGTLQPRKDRGA